MASRGSIDKATVVERSRARSGLLSGGELSAARDRGAASRSGEVLQLVAHLSSRFVNVPSGEADREVEAAPRRFDRGETRPSSSNLRCNAPDHVIVGELNKQIADRLNISSKTVKAHRARVMEKMEVHSVAMLVALCERVGIRSREPGV